MVTHFDNYFLSLAIIFSYLCASKFLLIGFIPWKLNLIRNGLKNERFLKRVGYEFIITYQLDLMIIFAMILGSFSAIKNPTGGNDPLRLLVYVCIVILGIYYLVKTKDIREIKNIVNENNKNFKKHIRPKFVSSSNIDDTLSRWKKAFSIIQQISKDSELALDNKENLKLIEKRYPKEVREALSLLNEDLKQDLSIFFFGLSAIQRVHLLRSFSPIEAKNMRVFLAILTLVFTFIISYLMN